MRSMISASAKHAAATQTASGMPSSRCNARSRIELSMTRTAEPPSAVLAIPRPTNQMPRVVMNEGMRSPTCMTPLSVPNALPATTASSGAHQPSALALASLAASSATIIVPSDMMPSTERSMLPITMMKVAPIARISGMAAAFATRTRLRSSIKFGLASVRATHRPTRTRAGARTPARRRSQALRAPRCPAAAASRTKLLACVSGT